MEFFYTVFSTPVCSCDSRTLMCRKSTQLCVVIVCTLAMDWTYTILHYHLSHASALESSGVRRVTYIDLYGDCCSSGQSNDNRTVHVWWMGSLINTLLQIYCWVKDFRKLVSIWCSYDKKTWWLTFWPPYRPRGLYRFAYCSMHNDAR